MGYFSNGSEGEGYIAEYCMRCIHGSDDEGECYGCPVIQLHMAWNYDAVGKNADKTKQAALEAFIPRDGITNLQCTMFVPKKGE